MNFAEDVAVVVVIVDFSVYLVSLCMLFNVQLQQKKRKACLEEREQ